VSGTIEKPEDAPLTGVEGLDLKGMNLPIIANHVFKMWKDVESFDLRGDHRGALTGAMATLQLAQEVQKLRLFLESLYE
jgi:hypothetical protein